MRNPDLIHAIDKWEPAPGNVIETYAAQVSPTWLERYYLGQLRMANATGDWWRARRHLRRSEANSSHETAIVGNRYGGTSERVRVCLTCAWISRDLAIQHIDSGAVEWLTVRTTPSGSTTPPDL